MALSPLRFTDIPFPFSLYTRTPPIRRTLSTFSIFSASSTTRNPKNPPIQSRTSSNPNPKPFPKNPPSSWLNKWTQSDPSSNPNSRTSSEEDRVQYFDGDKGRSAIHRIVDRLRNLGLSDGDGDDDSKDLPWGSREKGNLDDKDLGFLLQKTWERPDQVVNGDRISDALLPWERSEEGEYETKKEKSRRIKAPTLAELTIEDSELRRLRKLGITLRERINVPKAGVTQAVLEKIHMAWRKSELVRLKFHETLVHDMKTAHEIVERRTGGLVIWMSGSVMVVYRGSTYGQQPSSRPNTSEEEVIATNLVHEGDTLFVPDVAHSEKIPESARKNSIITAEKPSLFSVDEVPTLTEEEKEYNSILDGLGPRFVEWWGTGFLPVDADLLPQKVPGYKPPFRLLPIGMRSRLTNAEMTNLRKFARKLPSHFALGRNRNHQGMAAAIIKLWERSLIVKIAVKRGIQNTNNKLMAEELKKLTGGILLLRNKYYIVIYRGKDFLPPSVASALAERQALTKNIQDEEERARKGAIGAAEAELEKQEVLAGTLAEFKEAQARWGREIAAEEQEKMKEEISKAKHAGLVRRIEHKFAVAQAKKLRAEKQLSKIEASMVPVGPSDDQETVTDEERYMFRRVGLRMKAYLPLGIRGVFDGVIENMHLHWKHRELVKLISKQKTLAFVEETARLLEYESGGILIAIERVPKGYALIYYRGKNYQRPVTIRPRNLLTKAKALKRSVEMQRHEALSQHILELERTIEHMKLELHNPEINEGSSWESEENEGNNEYDDEDGSRWESDGEIEGHSQHVNEGGDSWDSEGELQKEGEDSDLDSDDA
ncbi:hypothetical protein AMTRI_Chr13g85620 [Amborella trichopoda]|uniref:CRM domain-containing protein n=1 Tax=Amborella trichopoda TaxID=13333 RepID=W1P292_AMBTC|nr:CRM-domain containing factor CFM3, chloroplastic/mitochondrial [Amborella trichopoda]ERN03972.1 hypothetical protein AMTR_s00079p00107040 [Amborella trichopoda]|eukprot:XP_006842297.1 CRM-domain containing factor CFM3, chloroplastic/mitochondrial [Amborella trichopoda]